ncbi:hypothetical protein C8Q80DRAFT_1066649, partial [Daedaleopsis nitida]
ELAPPCGMMADRYGRSVHREAQPHWFAISWTLRCTAPSTAGGHFYIARYAIQTKNLLDTLITWPPGLEHTTSLSKYDPYNPFP